MVYVYTACTRETNLLEKYYVIIIIVINVTMWQWR